MIIFGNFITIKTHETVEGLSYEIVDTKSSRKGSESLKKISNVSDISGDRGCLGRVSETNVCVPDDRP